MVKQLSNNITSFLVHENIIKSDEVEIYRYGIKQLLINGITIITVCIIATIIQKWIETVFFFVGLMPIRAVAGGYHASTPGRCNLLSLSVYLSSIVMIDFLSENASFWLYGFVSTIILLSIYIFAPVDHVNRKLTEDECRKCKKLSMGMATIIIISIMTSTIAFNAKSLVATGTLMGALIASVSIIIGNYKRRGERNEENGMVR